MRCYNGCPDKELQAWIDDRQKPIDEGKKMGVWITWFPIEQKYAACRQFDQPGGYADLSGFHSHPQQALDEAKTKLKELA